MDSKKNILDFLRKKIAAELRINESVIANDSSFHQLGLDSVNSLFLLNEVEEHFQIDIDPLSLYDNPTLDSFSEYLVDELVDINELWRPSHQSFVENPYPNYEKILAQTNLFRSPNGDFVVMGYDANKAVLKDTSFTSGNRTEWLMKMEAYALSKSMDFSYTTRMMGGTLTQLEAPKHTVLRDLLAQNWPKQDAIQSKADAISSELIGSLNGECDLAVLLSKKMPLLLISDLMGIDRATGLNHMEDGFRMVDILDPYLTLKDLIAIEQSARNLTEMMRVIYNNPIPGSIIDQVKSAQEPLNIEESDIISLLVFLFIAGFETNSALISRCLHYLITDEDLALQLESDESLIDPFVKEVLRLWSPVQITGRKASSDVTLGGLNIPKGSSLTLCIGAANRDPSHFDDPGKLMIDRVKNDHLSFGYGAHQCLGSNIALIEARTLIKKTLPIRHQIVSVKDPEFKGRLAVNSIKHMVVQISNS